MASVARNGASIALLSLAILHSQFAVVRSKTFSVTCGSTIKLKNTDHQVRLHSHEVQYGSGSGQQSVTGVSTADDVNSYWTILGHLQKPCTRGQAIKCGDVIRLQHLQTKAKLHSHHFKAPLSGNQEVSCFGDSDVRGDTGDHWVLECGVGEWERDTSVKLKHIDTTKYLHISGRTFNKPITGQYEVSAHGSSANGADWKAEEGVYINKGKSL